MEKMLIENKIDEIYEILTNYNETDIGLLSGLSGINLFLYQYNKLKNIDTSDILMKNISNAIEKINNGYNYHTFCAGLSGFTWSIEYYIKNNYFAREDCNVINQLDDFLYKKMMSDIKQGNFDYLHGAIGCGLYFANHLYNDRIYAYLDDLIDEIELLGIREKNGLIKWESTVLDSIGNSKKVFNLSMSHGIASIISFLSVLIKRGYNNPKVKKLLKGAVNYTLENMIDPHIYGSYFPSWVCEKDPITGSRLAWCYGDLGIAAAICNAYDVMGESNWGNISKEVLINSTNRKNSQSDTVKDAGICHGTSGISHIYNRMYFKTGIEELNIASKYWVDQTIKMAYHDDGLVGYKSWQTNMISKSGSWENIYRLLEGITGIGLVLISSISNNEPTWDECLLLN